MRLLCCLLVCFTAACSSTSGTAKPLVPDKVIQLTANNIVKLSTVLGGLAVAGAIHVIYDPLAPNWEIEEEQVNADTYRFALKMKRFHTGGAGESIQVLKRRASQLQREQGFAEYQIVEYSEGIDSQTLGARRVADGVIRLVRREQADSFGIDAAY